MIDETRRIYPIVKNILIDKKETRDNDELLYTMVVIERDNRYNLDSSYMEKEGRVKMGAVSRARRLCQQDFPETRGTLYYKRHKACEKMKAEINTI